METKIILESAKGVSNGKIQLCFSQVVETGQSSANVLGILNASDDRFNQKKPRYAWVTAEPKDAAEQFGIEALANIKEGEELILGVVDPQMKSAPGVSLNLQITETTEGSEYDVANFETRAKRAGKDGDFIMHNGQYIYTRVAVVAGAAKHRLIPSSETTRQPSGGGLSDAVKSALEG